MRSNYIIWMVSMERSVVFEACQNLCERRKQLTMLINSFVRTTHKCTDSPNSYACRNVWRLRFQYSTIANVCVHSLQRLWPARVRHLDVTICQCQCNGNLPGIMLQMYLIFSTSSSVANLSPSSSMIIVASCVCRQSIESTERMCTE